MLVNTSRSSHLEAGTKIMAGSLSRLTPNCRLSKISARPNSGLLLQTCPAGHRRAVSSTAASRSSTSSLALNLGLVLGGGLLGLGYATLFPSPLSRMLNPPQAPPSPTEDSAEGQAHIQKLEAALQSLPQVKALRLEKVPEQSAVTSLMPESQLLHINKWKEARPYTKYPEERRIHHFTAGLLRGPGRLAVRPLLFSSTDDKEAIIFLHLGRSLCGHE